MDRRDDSLGIAAAEIVGLAALPHLFDPGDPPNLSMQARNTGTVPLTGTAILRIEDGDGGPIQTFQQEFGGLAPEGIKAVDVVWDTAGNEANPYRLIGYALYEGTSTGPAILNLHTATRIYLPFILKGL